MTITTVGELRDRLAMYSQHAPLRVLTEPGEMDGIERITTIEGRLVLVPKRVSRKSEKMRRMRWRDG